MKTKRMKKWGRRILLGLLISLTVSIVAPSFMGDYVDTSDQTAYSATTLPPCDYNGNEKEPQCKIGDNKQFCPGGYVKDSTDPTICKPQTTEQATNEGIVNTAKFLIQIQELLNRAIWPVLVMIGGLMDNSLLFGNGMEERLREIWIPIRNIVNILFVVALVAIALYNVLGIGDENSNYSIKAILPKIIIGIIVVNFSFLGIKVFLDGINVLTTAIFALPNQVGTGMVLNPENTEDQDLIDKYCRSMSGKDYNESLDYVTVMKETDDKLYRRIAKSDEFKSYLKGVTVASTKAEIEQMVKDSKMSDDVKKSWDKTIADNQNGMICTLNEGKDKMELTNRGQLFLKRWNSRNASLAMALGLSKIVLYKQIELNSLKSLEKVFINTAMSLILYLLFAASFLALFVVLLGRLVVMWLAIALSPVLLLAMVIPAVKESAGGFGEIQTQFVQNAIAPLGIGLSLSVGWIMLKALQGLNGLYGGEQISFSATEGIPVVGLTTLQDLLVGVGTIAVIWLGVFAAASKSIAEPITGKMKDYLSSAGSWVGTLPLKHAPIFRIDLPNSIDGGDDKYTGTQVMDALSTMTQPKDRSKLSDRLGVHKARGEDILNKDKITNRDDVLGFLKNAKKEKMGTSELKSSMKNLVDKRGKLWKEIQNAPGGLGDRILALANAKDSKTAEKEKESLLAHGHVTGHRGSSKPDTKSTAPSVTTVTNNTTVTGTSTIGANATTVNKNLKQMSAELGTGSPQKAKIDSYLEAIRKSMPAGSELKDIKSKVIGTDMLESLKKVYRDDKGVDKAITG